ncbi:M15 family metallopeptidase [Microbacterium sp. SD291]|uniref:M15 family metallopeptidase n=1 Tax=Microbacterium sp. SD291 TaxID=2782007 RepID=UPI001A973E87|nr:M15 family metallopeptidase [Microbacterium sp. SD291]MBO0980659.1 M15 family metallopeptidase [Microbacterium sp. SD291]
MNSSRSLRQRRVTATIGVTLLAIVVVLSVIVIGQLPPAAASDRTITAPLMDGSVGEDDGLIHQEDQISVFDQTPAVANLDPELLAAVREAAATAEQEGVRMHVNSGWRSPAYQEALLSDAVERYGSAEEAARWVTTADNSEHVSGDAVDLGPVAAQDWLSQRGAEFGLCQIYANERWHFELRPAAVANGCPVMYEDPTADPRTQR